MKASLWLLSSATALALSGTALPALAADYEPPIVVDQPVEEVPIEVGTGWYLRGDIGYNFSVEADDGFPYRTFDPAFGYGNNVFDIASLSEEVTFGGGVGYNFTDMFRAEATIDGFRSNFDGQTFSAAPCSTALVYAGTTCRSEDGADVSIISLMVNGYVDLGTYVGLTPYVGAGIGYSYIDWGPLGDTVLCVGATCPGSSNLFSQTQHEGEDSWRFTYALMAGMAYDITSDIKLDVGYRYRHIDGGPMFSFDPATAGTGASGSQGEFPGFDTHEVRVGVRYSIW